MEFNGIDESNIVKNLYCKEKITTKPTPSEQKNKSENFKNAPNNPSYWQNYVGVKSNSR